MHPSLLLKNAPRATRGLAPQLDPGVTTLAAGLVAATPAAGPVAIGQVTTWKKQSKYNELWEIEDAAAVDAAGALWVYDSAPVPATFDGDAALAALAAKQNAAGAGRYMHLAFKYLRLPDPLVLAALPDDPAGSTATLWHLRGGQGPHSPAYTAPLNLSDTGVLYRLELADGSWEDHYVLHTTHTPPDADTAWELEAAAAATPTSLRAFLQQQQALPGSAQFAFVPVAYTVHAYTP